MGGGNHCVPACAWELIKVLQLGHFTATERRAWQQRPHSDQPLPGEAQQAAVLQIEASEGKQGTQAPFSTHFSIQWPFSTEGLQLQPPLHSTSARPMGCQLRR